MPTLLTGSNYVFARCDKSNKTFFISPMISYDNITTWMDGQIVCNIIIDTYGFSF